MNAGSEQEILEQIFQVTQPARLVLSNIRGTVQVRPGAADVIHVRAVKHLQNGDAEHTEVSLSQDADGSVRAETRYSEGVFLRRPSRVDYTVEVPTDCAVKLSGVSNAASIEGVQGEIQVSTISGDVQLAQLAGSLKVSSVSGNVRAERLSGALDLDTVSGDAALHDCQLESLRASAVSGDVQAHTPLSAGPYHFKSVSGDVSLFVPAETACTLQFDSLSGSVRSDLPITGRQKSIRRKVLQIQSGGVNVTHNSISGDLFVGAPLPPEPAPVDHMPVLERVERGELSVQEALEIMNK